MSAIRESEMGFGGSDQEEKTNPNVQYILESLDEVKEIRRKQIIDEAESKLKEKLDALDGTPKDTKKFVPELNIDATNLPQEGVAECKKLILNFKKFLYEKKKDSETQKAESQVIQSVNKNAYELRHMILENAIHVVSENLKNKNVSLDQFVDSIMKVSDRFYSFVENRK